MKFTIKAVEKRSMSRLLHQELDEQVQLIIAGTLEGIVDDVMVGDNSMYRRIKTFEIVNTPKFYFVYGNVEDMSTLEKLCDVFLQYGLKFNVELKA